MITLTDTISVPEYALRFFASRSSGPGGQNVNKVNTRVLLLLDIAACDNFTDQQKRLIRTRLANRIDCTGILRLFAQTHRSQAANRRAALQRLGELLQSALAVHAPRIATRVPRRVREKRLRDKKQRGRLKRLRGKISRSDMEG